MVEMMGRLLPRTSYGQNVLRHSIEVGFLSQMIAEQLGFDGTIARRAGFLHDIGKAMDHEAEGGHPAIGMDFAKRNGSSRISSTPSEGITATLKSSRRTPQL